jgi:hypothetical protein
MQEDKTRTVSFSARAEVAHCTTATPNEGRGQHTEWEKKDRAS